MTTVNASRRHNEAQRQRPASNTTPVGLYLLLIAGCRVLVAIESGTEPANPPFSERPQPPHGPDGEPPVARLTGRQGSGILTSMADADALMVVPESQAVVEEGQLMQAIVLDDPRHVQDVPW